MITHLKLSTVLLLLLMPAWRSTATDSLTFREIVRGEKRFSIQARAVLAAEAANQLDARSVFELNVGDFHFAAPLGSDGRFRSNRKSAIFREGKTRITLNWRNGLHVSATGTVVNDQTSALVRDGNQVCASVYLGGITIPFRGTVSSRSVGRSPKLRTVNLGTALRGDCRQAIATAAFSVDVKSGTARITAPGAQKSSLAKAIFTGSSVSFHTSTLLDQPSELGRKVLRVSLVNHAGETIGLLPNGNVGGLKVTFSRVLNAGGFSNAAQRTIVSTIAGTGASGNNDAVAAAATFAGPSGSAVSGNGTIYITDFNGNRLRVISGGYVSTLAGSGVAGGADGSGVAATLNGPQGIAINPVDESLIVADLNGNRVRRITPNGEVTTIAGTGTAGAGNGPGNTATLSNPTGVAVDSQGTIYVTEGAHRIRKIALAWRTNPRLAANYSVSTLAGSGSAGNADGVGAAATFTGPSGITIDSDGVLYVADRNNNRIRRVTGDGEVVTIAGTGTASSIDGQGNVATFNQPAGIACVNGALIISDFAGRRLRQMSLRADGAAAPANPRSWDVVTLAGTGAFGSADGTGTIATFNTPNLISSMDSGSIVIPDAGANLVRRMVLANGSFPVGTPTGAIPAELVRLANPDGFNPIPVAVASENAPYILYPTALAPEIESAPEDWAFVVPAGVSAFEFTVTVEGNTSYPAPLESAVSIGSSNVVVRTVAGQSLSGLIDGLGTEARFSSMVGIALDKSGNIYVADSFNNAIRRISAQGVVTTVAGGRGFGATNGPGSVARFNSPTSVAVSPDGRVLYVTDSGNNMIRRIDLGYGDPFVSGDCYVYTIAGAPGTASYVDNTTGDLARFNYPYGIAMTGGGNLIVSEYNGNRIRRLNFLGGDATVSNNWKVALVAGSTVSPAGTSGTNDANGSGARFTSPAQVAVDTAGNIFVADSQNYRVRKINANNDVTTVAGSTVGYADGAGSAAQFIETMGIAVTSAGYIYVGESGQRIRRISPSGVVTTVAGTGSTFPGDIDGTGDVATFYYPQGLALDPSGNLFITSGGTYLFSGGGGSTSPGLRVRVLQRVFSRSAP